MKVITWNCSGALRNKFEELINFQADIYVIQECEDPAKSNHKGYIAWAKNHLWIGDNKNKGIGVFAKVEVEIIKLDWTNYYKDHTVKHFLPCLINREFNLLAVWTHSNNSPTFGYIGQLWKYLQLNKNKLNKCIILGDLNSNKIWDNWDRWWNHSDVLKELNGIGIESFYHKYWDEEQGKESQPTFFLNRKIEKPYHIDYIFGSNEFSSNVKSIEIGNKNKWLKLSDHLPLICEIT
ncbi:MULTISPECIES: endonuclease/exonuclease/phosphatase family protein [unclassified Flavobacterium]|uniref:endonuclease/exonuclease/phosphatase family protein n=1 Tax=unclassified Flavobacterium TaxID=196869 RepID=UPI003F9221B5